jgi:hypothetical protein
VRTSAATHDDIGKALSRASEMGVHGLVVTSDSFFFSRSERLAALAIGYKLPTIHGFCESAIAGGLMSYGGGRVESFRWLVAKSSRARIRQTYLSSRAPKLNWSSISKLP